MPAKLYPVEKGVYELARDGIRVLYQPTLRGRARGAIGVVRDLLMKK